MKQLNKFLNLGSGRKDYSKRQEQEALRQLLNDEGDDSDMLISLKGDQSLASQLQSVKQAHPELVHFPASKTMKMAVAAAGGRFRLHNQKEKPSNSLLYSPFNGIPGSIVQQIPSNPNVVNYPGKQYPVGREKLSPRSAALKTDSNFTVVCEKCGKLVHGYTNFQEHQRQHAQVSKRYLHNKQYIAKKREQLGHMVKLPNGQKHQRNEYDVNADDLLLEHRRESQLSIHNAIRKLKSRNFEEAHKDLVTLVHQHHNIYAMVELGHLYIKGCAVEEDVHQAYHYYKMACFQESNITKQVNLSVLDAILEITSPTWDSLDASLKQKAFRAIQKHAYPIKCDWFQQSQISAHTPVAHPSQANQHQQRVSKKSSHSSRSSSPPHKHQHHRLLHQKLTSAPDVHVERITSESSIIYFYCLCLLRGLGCEVNEEEGLQLIRKNAAKGHPPSLLLLARAYRDGSYGLSISYNQAIKLLKQVITYEYPAACNVLGLLYETGKGVNASDDMAVKLYQQGLFLGSLASQQCIDDMNERKMKDKRS
eukprot:CAMPEP_0117424116 /NCGR_PEP_ID=MMETSP0758-20121206/4595_1 /TAXON_ID=63605 /ORGANISM="Percolomonas cosmopolitus, Strain AE-1 (ATCC 50343)" /LENGTH=534 /DNA_ID=CAMNT_0005207693 /DNA_START=276 /DNA_END=1876 /DNA_ORIENTATION=-